ncbi:MAG: hypothetical protein NC300_10635 [Bacteroidales bacterium]|nr:hypothetical protein [Clostridium sp.]MCM1204587.1 hypothetical protein [Bacteroidales bacterium]
MNRLIKAEWYRMRHSSNLMKWLVVICLVGVGLPLMNDFGIYQNDLTKCLYLSDEVVTMFLPAFLGTFCAAALGISYMNKTAYYEVMAGNKISKILLSKVMVNAFFATVVQSLFFCVCWTIISANYGRGKIGQLPLRVVLFVIILLHICTAGVLIAASVRHMAASVLAYLRFAAFDLAALFIVQIFEDYIPAAVREKIVDWFIMIQLSKVLNYEWEITDYLIFAVMMSMLLEAGIWYAASYVGMRKKIY